MKRTAQRVLPPPVRDLPDTLVNARKAAEEAQKWMEEAENGNYDPLSMASLWVGVGKHWVNVHRLENTPSGDAASRLRERANELLQQANELDLADAEASDD